MLMMVCVQSFSMHFHLAPISDAHQTDHHAHTHSIGDLGLEHQSDGHGDEQASADFLVTVFKQSLVLGLIFIALVTALVLPSYMVLFRWCIRKHRLRDYLFFLHPQLRAPPL